MPQNLSTFLVTENMKSNFLILSFLLFALIVFNSVKTCAGDNVKKSVDDNRDDNGETNDEAKDESLDIPAENEPNNVTCTRRQNSQMHEIRSAEYKQFPFMASVMSHQNEHLCSGTVVSNGLILTTAQCTQQPISYVLLNATKSRKNDYTVALHVIKTEKFPTFTGPESDKDVGLIYTEKHNSSLAAKIKLSNFTSSRSITDMELLGFGLNAEMGQVKELQCIGLENRMASLHFTDLRDIILGYIDCIESKVPTCFKDTGGPAIFDNELVGIVVKGEDKCLKEITPTYAINKKVADVLPTYTFKGWLDEKIKANEEVDQVTLAVYPNRPLIARRQPVYSQTSAAKGLSLISRPLYIMGVLYLTNPLL